MVHEEKSAVEIKEDLDFRPEIKENMALLVTRTPGDPKDIRVARQVVL